MSDINQNFAIRQFQPNAAVPVPIVCPITCSQIVLENTDALNAVQVFTDPSTPAQILATTKNIPAGLELTLRAGVPSAWGPNSPVCYVLGTAVSGLVTVTFLR